MRPIILVPSLCAVITALPSAYIAGEAPTPPAISPATPPPKETVVVTAPRESLTNATTATAAEKVATIPGGAAVIPATDYLDGRASTLRDMLGGSAGVVVQPRFGSEESRLSIRGSGIQRTFHLRGIFLMQDGQPINQADGSADFQALDPGMLDHIEVYRGGNALEYGASTLGGAINFVTPTAYTAPAAQARIEAGSFGFVKATAGGGFITGPLDAYLMASAYRQDGYRDHSQQEDVRLFGNLGWRFAPTVENRVYLALSNTDSELPGDLTRAQFDADPTQANPASKLRDTKRDYPYYRVADRFVVEWNTERLEVGVGYAREELFHPLSFGLIEQDSDNLNGNLRFETTAPLGGRRNRLVLGVNAYYSAVDAFTFAYSASSGHPKGAKTSDAVQTATTTEAFVEERLEVAKGWWGVLGAQAVSAKRDFADRFLSNGDQTDDKTYRALNPKIGVLWEIRDRIQGYANVSRSYEPPTFAEFVQRDTSGATRPQQGLEGQSAWTAEIGTRGDLPKVAWDVSLYYAQVRDEYLSFQIAPGLTQTTNADKTVHAGFELAVDVEAAADVFTAHDRLIVGQTFTWGRFRFDDDTVNGNNQLPGLPEYVWRGELRWEHPAGWYAATIVDWQSGWPVDFANTLETDSAFQVGVRCGYRTRHGFSVFIEGRNLFDQDYAATSGIASPLVPATSAAVFSPGDGRAFYAGLEWKL